MPRRSKKDEAVRFADAKKAIKKLKLKRKEKKKLERAASSTTSPPFIVKQNFDGFTEADLQDFHREVICDNTNENLPNKILVTSKTPAVEASGSGVNFGVVKPRPVVDASLVDDVSSQYFTSKGRLDLASPDEYRVRSAKRTYSANSKMTYQNAKNSADIQEDDSLHNSPFLKPSSKTRKSKPLKARPEKKGAKHKTVPMSITMSTVEPRGFVFTCVDDDNDENQLKAGRKSGIKFPSGIISNTPKPSKSSFSITTVSDTSLIQAEGTNSEDEQVETESLVGSESESNLAVHIDEELDPVRNDSNEAFMDVSDVTEAIKRVKNDGSKAEFHFIDGCVILHLKHPASFVFCGQVQLEVLKGTVEILGYSFTSTVGSLTAYSPRGSSLLALHTVLHEQDQVFSPVDLDSSTLKSLFLEGNPGDAFLMLKKAESILPIFLEQYISMKLFPQLSTAEGEDQFLKAGKKLNCIFSPPSGCELFQKGERWDEVSEHVLSDPGCSVLCGGKGVGKSTMLRFLVNRLLSRGKEGVVLIDLDPGQAELTVPGCVSISIVRKPLLGPNFTHLQNSDRCIYVGDVNVSNCVSRYLDACVAIINHWHSQEHFKDMPCLVNTMGFNKGLGVPLMVEMISIIQPSSVIQILSKSASHNYPELLSACNVQRNCSNSPFRLKMDKQILTQGRRLSSSNIKYNLHVIDSAAESKTHCKQQRGLDARSLREIVILSYFSQIVSPPRFSLLEVVPFCCALDANYLSICHESVPPSITLSVFNASLVALCVANPKEEDVVKTSVAGLPSVITRLPSADCLGFGIVRGICMDSKQLYLLTPVPPSKLIDVNCLVVGAVSLPACVLLTPPKEPGPVPYAVVGKGQTTAQTTKRSFRYRKVNA